MKDFIKKAIILLFVGTILVSLLLRVVFDRVRDSILDGIGGAIKTVTVTVGSILDDIDIDSNGIMFGGEQLDFGELDLLPYLVPEQTAPLDTAEESSPTEQIDASSFEKKRYEFDADGCDGLDISVANCDIVVAAGDYGKITVDLLESEDFGYSLAISDGRLTVRERDSQVEEVKIFGVSLGPRENRPVYTGLVMAVGLPEDFAGEITVSTTNGDLKLGNLSLEERLTVSTSNGKIVLSDIDALDISATTSNARIELSSLSATEIKAVTSGDRITLDSLTSKRLEATTSDASIDFVRLFGEKFTFNTTHGDIGGSILGVKELFSVETLTDRTASPESVNRADSRYRLYAKTVGGDILVRFVD